nr:hypothetical protein [uncultured Rhodopila sp.]
MHRHIGRVVQPGAQRGQVRLAAEQRQGAGRRGKNVEFARRLARARLAAAIGRGHLTAFQRQAQAGVAEHGGDGVAVAGDRDGVVHGLGMDRPVGHARASGLGV